MAGPSDHAEWESEPDYSMPSGAEGFSPARSDLVSSGQQPPSKSRAPESRQNCASKAVNGVWTGARFGLLAGAVGTALEVMEWGLRGPAALSAVVRGAASGAFAFGSGIGLYQGAVCGIEQVRGVQDIYNSMLAGGLVGAMAEVPVIVRNYLLRDVDNFLNQQGKYLVKPRPRFFVGSAVGAAGCGMLYLLESSSKSKRQPQIDSARVPTPIAGERNKDLTISSDWVQEKDSWSFDEDAGMVDRVEFAVEPYMDSSGAATS